MHGGSDAGSRLTSKFRSRTYWLKGLLGIDEGRGEESMVINV